MTRLLFSMVALVMIVAPPNAVSNPEALEIGADNVDQLPGGKEADGIIGDFVLRNDKIEAVISGDLPNRRANMTTFWGEGGITPGTIYDLTLRGSHNDQITIFAPLKQQGPVSYVRIRKDGSDGEAVIEVMVTAETGKGIARTHEYILRDGWQGVRVRTILRNAGAAEAAVKTADYRKPVGDKGTFMGVTWGGCVDPAHKAGHAFAWIAKEGEDVPRELVLQPGESRTLERFVAVGNSPAEAAGVVLGRIGNTGTLTGVVKDKDGKPVATGEVRVRRGNQQIPAWPLDDGRYSIQLPPGKYDIAFTDIGRPLEVASAEIRPGESAQCDAAMERASAIVFQFHGEGGSLLPCKAQIIGVDGTKSPNLGPQNRAHGCKDQYHSENGRFRVQVPPGNYRIVVTRGPEFDHFEERIAVGEGETVTLTGELKRVVSTPGWVSTDYHNHSTPSGDNQCGTDDRVINLAAEHVEFAPTTEHNRLDDWRPNIERLGLAEHLQTVPGVEVTGSGEHFNAFPMKPVPHRQDGGAPVWQKDPRLNAIVLRDFQGEEPDRWVHVNHPDMAGNFVDRNGDSRPDGGYLYFGQLIDGLETQNNHPAWILYGKPFHIGKQLGPRGRIREVREFIWLQLLNRGLPVHAIAVADAHSVHGNGVGGWRTYVKSSTDKPAEIDWREMSRMSKGGKMILSSGPYLEVTAGDGGIAGDHIRWTGTLLPVKVRVQCTTWLDIDRVQVLVNSRPFKSLNFTRETHPDFFGDGVVKFDRTIDVPLSEDSHIIVVAIGEKSDLSRGFGSSDQARRRPCAYNNPIFVDVDGGGFTPNGDTLGFPLPVKGLSVDKARILMGEPPSRPPASAGAKPSN